MANTLTAILPILFDAKDIVARELVGLIPAVTRDSSGERAAKDQVITYPIVPAITGEDITPGAVPADSGDQTVGSGTMTISKSRAFPIRWTGEEQQSLRNGDNPQLANVLRDQFAQAMRAGVNEIESDLALLYKKASRAYGTSGTTPFGTANDLSDAAQVRKILDDNGVPQSDLHLVLGSAAMANIRGKQSVLFKVNEAGTAELLRRGTIGELEGFELHNSAQIRSHTIGGGTSYQTNGTQALAATTLAVDTGTGTIVAGDVITIANGTPADSNQYVVKTALSGGNVIIANPGLLSSHVDNDAVTITAAYRANMAFHRGAIHLITRTPAMPDGGDDADDVYTLTDEVSGLSWQIAIYRQYRRVKIEVGMAWGCDVVKPEFLALLKG